MNEQEPSMQFFSYFVAPGFWIEDIPVTEDEAQTLMSFFNCSAQLSLALKLKIAGDVTAIYLSRANVMTAMISKKPMGGGKELAEEVQQQNTYEIDTPVRKPDPRARDPYGLKA